MGGPAFDPVVLGHRLRHLRREADLTLAALGKRIGRPASYLSQVENGRIEPRLGVLGILADALGCTTADLLDPTPPSRRAELEIELDRHQRGPWRTTLELPEVRAGARLDDDVLEAEGVTDFSVYLNGGREEDLALDFWVDPKGPHDASKRL